LPSLPAPYTGEGLDRPPLDTLFPAAPVASKGRLLQYADRILRPYQGKATAEVHDYHDEHDCVLASSLAKRAPCGCRKRHPQANNSSHVTLTTTTLRCSSKMT
jgi:superfamily II DNA or RNA helicase